MPFFRPHETRPALHSDELVTKQSHKDECDIHNILKQYKQTGIITHVQQARPSYTDLPDDIDYQTSLNTILAAEEAFAALPSSVRDHFQNDPGRFLAAFSDEKQSDKLREFGLITPKDEPQGPPRGSSTPPGSQGSEQAPAASPPSPEPKT